MQTTEPGGPRPNPDILASALGDAIGEKAATTVRLSFNASEGTQGLQTHVLELLAGRAYELGSPLPASSNWDRLNARIRDVRLPLGHTAINAALRPAQGLFWAMNFRDIVTSTYGHDPSKLPTARQLEKRVDVVGNELDILGIRRLSSFRPKEMEEANQSFRPYRSRPLSTDEILENWLVPGLISAETRWQQEGRPGKKDDPHKSVLLKGCREALVKLQRGRPLNAFDVLYLDVADQLARLEPGHPDYDDYQFLIELYNAHHPDNQPVDTLHGQ